MRSTFRLGATLLAGSMVMSCHAVLDKNEYKPFLPLSQASAAEFQFNAPIPDVNVGYMFSPLDAFDVSSLIAATMAQQNSKELQFLRTIDRKMISINAPSMNAARSLTFFDYWMSYAADTIIYRSNEATPHDIEDLIQDKRMSAVPEPAGWIIALLGVGAVIARNRRC